MVEGANALPDPSAQGSFDKTPLPNVLLYVHERKLDGTLELSAPNNETATIVFVGGQPAKARTSQPVAYLGRVLVELGMFNEAQLAESLRTATRDKRLHGHVLVSTGLITEEQLDRGLFAQLGRKLRYLARLPPETIFRYYDRLDLLQAYGRDSRVRLDPFPIVWAAIREAPSWEHIHIALLRLGNSALGLAKGSELARFEFETGERATADLLRTRPHRVDDLVAAGVVDPRIAQQLLYCLLLAKQLELAGGSRPAVSSATDEPPVDTPRRLPEDPEAELRFVADEFAKADTGPLAKPTTRGPHMPTDGVVPREAYTRPTAPSMPAVRPPTSNPAARIVHPAPVAPSVSALPVVHPAPPPPSVAAPPSVHPAPPVSALPVVHPAPPPPSVAPSPSVAAQEAEVLRTPAPSEVDGGVVMDRYAQLQMSEPPPSIDPAAKGVHHFEQAQALLKRGELANAEAHCKKAVVCDLENAEYLALLGWISGLLAENGGRVGTEVAIERLDKALRMNPRLVDAHFHRAVLHKRLGREEEALADYRREVENNPDNRDAQREIRLIEMRRTKKDTDKGNLLGRLFGGKKP